MSAKTIMRVGCTVCFLGVCVMVRGRGGKIRYQDICMSTVCNAIHHDTCITLDISGNQADKQIKGWLKVWSSCLLYHPRLPNWVVLPVLHTILQILYGARSTAKKMQSRSSTRIFFRGSIGAKSDCTEGLGVAVPVVVKICSVGFRNRAFVSLSQWQISRA
jgi:hypothetical protein